MSNKLHVKKGDTVVIISGDDRGNKGKVLDVSPKEGKVIVEGINVATKQQADSGRPQAIRRRFQIPHLQALRRNAVRR